MPKRRAYKTGASSSAAPPPPKIFPYQDGNVLAFGSEAKLNRFITKFENRDILPPRFSTMRYLENFALAVLFLQQSNLLNFLLLSYDFINLTLIRAFYSNLRQNDQGDLVTFVNGFKIVVSDETLNDIANLPNNGENISQYVGAEGELFDETAFLHQAGVVDPPTSNRRPTITGMDPNYRLICYFITRVLKPRKSSHTTLTKEDVKLMHGIATGARINYCKLIKLHMHAATAEGKPLPYAILVMKLLESVGIITENGPLQNRTKIWEISESSFHGGGDHQNPPPQNPPPQDPPHDAHHCPNAETLARIETKIDTLSGYVLGYFNHINYQYGAVTPFPGPSHNMDKDNDEDDDGDDDEN